MNILLIGIGYFPYLITGDKNFWFYLTTELSKSVENIFIFSINDQLEKVQKQQCERNNIYIYNIKRPFHFNKGYSGTTVTYYHHLHKPPLEILERSLTLMKIYNRLKKIVKEKPFYGDVEGEFPTCTFHGFLKIPCANKPLESAWVDIL